MEGALRSGARAAEQLLSVETASPRIGCANRRGSDALTSSPPAQPRHGRRLPGPVRRPRTAARTPPLSVGSEADRRQHASAARTSATTTIRSTDVRDGSLLAKDFKLGQLPAGPARRRRSPPARPGLRAFRALPGRRARPGSAAWSGSSRRARWTPAPRSPRTRSALPASASSARRPARRRHHGRRPQRADRRRPRPDRSERRKHRPRQRARDRLRGGGDRLELERHGVRPVRERLVAPIWPKWMASTSAWVREVEEVENARFVAERPRSMALTARGRRSMPRGVPMSWMAELYDHPAVWVDRGEGARFTDVDGHTYVDLIVADLSAFCGRAPCAVVRAPSPERSRATPVSAPRRGRGRRRRAPRRPLRPAQVAVHPLGDPANTEVIRLARELTGRSVVLMFDAKYHGEGDTTLVVEQDGVVVPESRGLPPGAPTIPASSRSTTPPRSRRRSLPATSPSC